MDQFDYKYARGQFWRVGAALAAFLGSAFALQFASRMLVLISPEIFGSDSAILLLGIFSMYFVGIPLAIWIMRSGKKCVFKPTVKMKAIDFLVAFLVMYAIAIIGNVISSLLMGSAEILLDKEIMNPVDEMYQGVGFWINMVAVVILAPVFEELLFRKCIIDAVLPYGEGVTILLSAVTFGIAHGNFFQFFYAAGIGALLAYIYIRTGKIKNTIILHALFNFAGGAIPSVLLELYGDQGSLMTLLYSFFVVAAVIAGIVLFIVNCRKIVINKATLPIPDGKKFSVVYLNPGMIIFFILTVGLFVLNIMS